MKNPTSNARAVRVLTLLAVLGAAAAFWALFLWKELVDARGGGTPFCVFGESDCAALWDAAFASHVHRFTGLPVAAWGLVWGALACLLPLRARSALAAGRGAARPLNAVKWTAAAGALGIVVLLAASAAEGLFCSSCAITYVATLAYAGVAFFVLEPGGLPGLPGSGTALAATLAVYALLLYPGLKTPKSKAREEQRVVAEAAERQAAERRASGAVDPRADGQLEEFVASLRPELRQSLSDVLAAYREARYHEESPRALQGSPEAALRITDFTDALCSHCANLHNTITYLRNTLPPDSVSVDSRHFPLDGNCNARLQIRGPESVRCEAARAQICMEQTPHALEYSGAVFEKQRGLTLETLYELAAPYMDRATLEACMQSDETARKLAADVEYAWHFEPTGTPLLLLNGREAIFFGPFLYAMALAGGNAEHSVFGSLPPPHPIR